MADHSQIRPKSERCAIERVGNSLVRSGPVLLKIFRIAFEPFDVRFEVVDVHQSQVKEFLVVMGMSGGRLPPAVSLSFCGVRSISKFTMTNSLYMNIAIN